MRGLTVFLLTSFLISTILFTSCSQSTSIIGEWEDENEIISFREDGTFSSPYYWLGGTYSVDDTELTISTMLGKEKYSVSIKEDYLTFSNSNGVVQYKFKKVLSKD